eukprot:scaffold196915_cov51-Prasinocladus_malaysianus.AAC.2
MPLTFWEPFNGPWARNVGKVEWLPVMREATQTVGRKQYVRFDFSLQTRAHAVSCSHASYSTRAWRHPSGQSSTFTPARRAIVDSI